MIATALGSTHQHELTLSVVTLHPTFDDLLSGQGHSLAKLGTLRGVCDRCLTVQWKS